ncbi:MAG: RAD55 family ATPase [Halobacteriales archaeon]
MVEQVQTGIEGLDQILNGGFVKNAAVLVSGNPGTGKSILGMQFLYNGVEQFDENGLYLSFEEDENALAIAADSIGFENWAEHVEDERIEVFDKQVLLRDTDFTETLDRIAETLESGQYQRLVMDSLSMFETFFGSETKKRRYLLQFTDILKNYGVTSLLINEQGALFPDTDIGLENYLTDGNIYLIQTPTNSGVNRYIWVAKMRANDVTTDIFPMDIDEGGIIIHDSAAGFSMLQGNTSGGGFGFDSIE